MKFLAFCAAATAAALLIFGIGFLIAGRKR